MAGAGIAPCLSVKVLVLDELVYDANEILNKIGINLLCTQVVWLGSRSLVFCGVIQGVSVSLWQVRIRVIILAIECHHASHVALGVVGIGLHALSMHKDIGRGDGIGVVDSKSTDVTEASGNSYHCIALGVHQHIDLGLGVDVVNSVRGIV